LALAACCATELVLIYDAGRLSYDITIMGPSMINIWSGCVFMFYVMRYLARYPSPGAIIAHLRDV
jgi:hypothetical protein